jgi:hypothetical protein
VKVDAFSKPRTYVLIGVALVGLFLLYQLWVWEVERVEVAPNTFLVKINRWGTDLPEGEIVAPDDSYKGIQRKVLTEGRHFLNPILYGYEKCAVLQVPEGQCAVLTRKAGTEIPSEDKARGAFLAEGEFDQFAAEKPGQRGILEKVLPPGKYYVNPYEYSHELIKAVEVRADQVGVRVLKWGKDPRAQVGAASPYVVPAGFRGVQDKPLEPATYYINPYVEEIVPVSIRSHPVEFSDIYFPSRDGFLIQPHVLVAYKVLPEMAPELFVMLCDDGRLPQAGATPEEQKRNPILQKVVLPLIRGYVRIEGSKYDAREYVSQQRDAKDEKKVNPREKLQEELMKKVAPACKKVGVIIETITVAQPEMNKDLDKLADAISQREQTRLTREKNKQLVEQHKQEQEQQAKEATAAQRTKVVDANTKLEQEKINAKRRKEVEELKWEASLKAAKERLEGAKKRAEATVTEGKAEAAIIVAKNEAEVAGLKTAVMGFPTPEQYAQYQVVTKLAPALSEIFASDTSEFAKVFSTYMSPAGRAPQAPARNNRADAKSADGKKSAD